MFPEIVIDIGKNTFTLYAFGLFLSVSCLLFLWMIRKLCRKLDIPRAFFFANLLAFFLATFFTSRIIHIITYWGIPGRSSFSFEYPSSFFSMSDFYFSLGGALLGFGAVFYWKLKQLDRPEEEKLKYLDITVVSFLFAAIVGYLGGFLGGQIYGNVTDFIINIDYTLYNPNLGEVPRIPIALYYAFLSGIIFSAMYMIRTTHSEDGLVSYWGMGLFGVMVLFGEFFTASSIDNLQSLIFLNFNQIIALILIVIGIKGVRKTLTLTGNDSQKKNT